MPDTLIVPYLRPLPDLLEVHTQQPLLWRVCIRANLSCGVPVLLILMQRIEHTTFMPRLIFHRCCSDGTKSESHEEHLTVSAMRLSLPAHRNVAQFTARWPLAMRQPNHDVRSPLALQAAASEMEAIAILSAPILFQLMTHAAPRFLNALFTRMPPRTLAC